MEEGVADDMDDNGDDDYDKMENLVNDVLGDNNDKGNDDYDAVAYNDINSKDGGSGEVDSNNEEEEFFLVFEEEEGATVTTTE